MLNDQKHENDHKHDKDHKAGRSIAARFTSVAEAREAITALHKAHYTHTWLGTTSVAVATGGDETVTVESGSGFFSQTQSLVDALVAHGVLGDTARQIERSLDPGDALITVDPKDRDVLEATSLIEQHGGHIAGNAADADSDLWLAPTQPRSAIRAAMDPAADYGEEAAFFERR